MSDAKATSVASETAESVEQAPTWNENDGEKETERSVKEEGTREAKGNKEAKDAKQKKRSSVENGNVVSESSPQKRKKRKFPSREEISKAR